jgi:lysyl-tRNA synthetase class 2
MNDAKSSNTFRDRRIEKMEAFRRDGGDPYPARVQRSDSNRDLQQEFATLAPDTVADKRAQVAGRIQSIRNDGMFIDIFDGTDRLQLFSDLKTASPELKAVLKALDLGDFVGASGQVRRTRRGELTLNVEAMTLLTKTLLPPPEKYHGMTDTELRYRKRYVDFIASAESRQVLLTRYKLISAVRSFLTAEGFLEVETPILQPLYGGATAEPFRTHHNTLDMDLYLRIAPELYLKRLLVGGVSDKIFELNRNFRNEGLSTRHNPEFTMLEVYQAYADAGVMMDLLERMMAFAVTTATGSARVKLGDVEIAIKPPFPRLSMIDEASRALGADFRKENDLGKLRSLVADKLASKLAHKIDDQATWGDLVALVFETLCEAKLVEPTHVIDFPADISPLAKRSAGDPRIAERFETYCFGMEIANAFSEMNDPLAQRRILEQQVEAAHRAKEFDKKVDEDFLEALEYGMPPSGGLGVGIDRLAMIAAGVSSIREVIAFPTVRPL